MNKIKNVVRKVMNLEDSLPAVFLAIVITFSIINILEIFSLLSTEKLFGLGYGEWIIYPFLRAIDLLAIVFWVFGLIVYFILLYSIPIYRENNFEFKTTWSQLFSSNKTLTKNKKLKSKSEYAKAIGLVSLGFILATIIILPKTENATYKAKCELYTPMSNYERYRSKTSWDRVIEIEYTTGIFWNQKFVLNKYIELDDVSTFKGHAEGTKYPARSSGYNANLGRKLKFVYDEVYKSLYVEEFDKYDNLSKLVRYQCK